MTTARATATSALRCIVCSRAGGGMDSLECVVFFGGERGLLSLSVLVSARGNDAGSDGAWARRRRTSCDFNGLAFRWGFGKGQRGGRGRGEGVRQERRERERASGVERPVRANGARGALPRRARPVSGLDINQSGRARLLQDPAPRGYRGRRALLGLLLFGRSSSWSFSPFGFVLCSRRARWSLFWRSFVGSG